MKISYNKLIRDKIPQIIEATGKIPTVRVLKHEEYLKELNSKLTEESNEWLGSGNTEELADILEVVLALATVNGIDFEQLVDLANEKRVNRGGFDKRLFLEYVMEAES